jgi:hypothetical protein
MRSRVTNILVRMSEMTYGWVPVFIVIFVLVFAMFSYIDRR